MPIFPVDIRVLKIETMLLNVFYFSQLHAPRSKIKLFLWLFIYAVANNTITKWKIYIYFQSLKDFKYPYDKVYGLPYSSFRSKKKLVNKF